MRSRPCARSAAKRGSSSATSTSACTSCARRRCERRAALCRDARLAAALGIEARSVPATDDRLRTWIDDAGRRVPVPGVVRRARPSRRGRRGALRGRRRGDAGARRARGDRRAPSWSSSRRATRTSRSARSSRSPEIRDALARRRVPCVAVSPLIGGRAVKGPADRMLRRLAGGTSPAHVAGCLSGLIDALVVDEADARRPRRPRRRAADRHADADVRSATRAGGSPKLRSERCRRMKIAVVGGTGDFGSALARRLVEAGEEVMIGSRDAERAAATGAEVGAARGVANDEAVRGVDLVVLAVKADGRARATAELAEAIGDTPVLSVASELRFTKAARLPERGRAARSPSGRRICCAAPVVAGLHSLAAASLASREGRRRRARLRRRRRGEGARARARGARSSPAGRSTPGRSRARGRSRA